MNKHIDSNSNDLPTFKHISEYDLIDLSEIKEIGTYTGTIRPFDYDGYSELFDCYDVADVEDSHMQSATKYGW